MIRLPVWVRLGHSAMSDQCPDYPGNRTSATHHGNVAWVPEPAV